MHLCICMFACLYVYMYVFIYTCIYVCICVYMYACMCIYAYIHTYIYIHAHVCIFTDALGVNVSNGIHAFICACMHDCCNSILHARRDFRIHACMYHVCTYVCKTHPHINFFLFLHIPLQHVSHQRLYM